MPAEEIDGLQERKRAWKLLIRIKKLLERNSITWWLESGTLLGFIRDGDFIAPVTNINIGIPAEEIEKVRRIHPWSIPGYRLKRINDRSGCTWVEGYESGICTKPLVHIRDKVFFIKYLPIFITPRYTVGETARWVECSNSRTCKAVSSHFYRKLDTLTVKGVSFPIPQDTERYLSQRYGDFRTRRNSWNTHADDKTIVDKKILEGLPKKTRVSDRRDKFNKKMRLTGDDLKRARKMLEDTVTILERNNIPYWLDAGTLLGIIRDNDFIPWDYDIDLGVASIHIDRVIALKRQFFPKYRLVTRPLKSAVIPGTYRSCKVKRTLGKLSFLHSKEELHLDIFFKYKIDNHYCWIDSNITKRVDAAFHDNLDRITWKGKSYSIPSNVEAYLTRRYGDWRTPVENYDASIHDKAIFE